MPDIHIVRAAVVESLRRKAKLLKKQEGIPHHEALDMVARKTGAFANWHQFIEEAKATEPAEQAFKQGLVIGLDRKEVDGFRSFGPFVDDECLRLFVLEEVQSKVRENGPRYEGESLEDLEMEYFELVFLRHKKATFADYKAVEQLLAKEFFFPPRYIRFKGELIEDWLWDVEDD